MDRNEMTTCFIRKIAREEVQKALQRCAYGDPTKFELTYKPVSVSGDACGGREVILVSDLIGWLESEIAMENDLRAAASMTDQGLHYSSGKSSAFHLIKGYVTRGGLV